MRMWMVNPKRMCKNHLLGEHVECHMLASSINLKRSIQGHLDKGQVEVHKIHQRHAELVKEMRARGYKHQSKLKPFKSFRAGKIDILANERELERRCKKCMMK